MTTVGKSRASSHKTLELYDGPAQANLDALPPPPPGDEPALDIKLSNVKFAYERNVEKVTYNLRNIQLDLPQVR